MIEASLDGLAIKPWSLWPIPDLHNWQRWFDRIVNDLPDFFKIQLRVCWGTRNRMVRINATEEEDRR